MPLKGETNSDSGMGLAIHKSASTLGVARQAGSCIRSRTNRSEIDLAAETAPRLGSGFPFHRGSPQQTHLDLKRSPANAPSYGARVAAQADQDTYVLTLL